MRRLMGPPSAADLYVLRCDNTERQECTLCTECGAVIIKGLSDFHKVWHERTRDVLELLDNQVGNLR